MGSRCFFFDGVQWDEDWFERGSMRDKEKEVEGNAGERARRVVKVKRCKKKWRIIWRGHWTWRTFFSRWLAFYLRTLRGQICINAGTRIVPPLFFYLPCWLIFRAFSLSELMWVFYYKILFLPARWWQSENVTAIDLPLCVKYKKKKATSHLSHYCLDYFHICLPPIFRTRFEDCARKTTTYYNRTVRKEREASG